MNKPEDGFTCYWIIENFSIGKNSVDYSLSSPLFSVSMLNDSFWHLTLTHSFSDKLNLALYKDGRSGNSNIDFQICILTKYGWHNVADESKKFRPGGIGYSVMLVDWNDVFEETAFLLNGCLIISCNLYNGATKDLFEQCVMKTKLTSGNVVMNESKEKYTSMSDFSLIELLGYSLCKTKPTSSAKAVQTKSTQTESTKSYNLVQDEPLSKEKKLQYVMLKTKAKEFAVPKVLLCDNSPVFNAMLHGKMKESSNNRVDIDDIESDTLSLFVQFLFQEPLNDLEWDAVEKLYYVAEKYQVNQLKEKCRTTLIEKLSVTTICKAFLAADHYQDEELQNHAHYYFFKNSKNIFPSAEWKELLFSRADLVSNILCQLAENQL